MRRERGGGSAKVVWSLVLGLGCASTAGETRGAPGDASTGCEDGGACEYPSCGALDRSLPSGVYTLTSGGQRWRAYCDMRSDGGGWTLILKGRGDDARLLYDSALWTNTEVLDEGSTDLSQRSAKFRGFFTQPFTHLRLVMLDGAPRALVLREGGASLREVLAGGYRATTAGRDAWRSLVAAPSLQSNCNREGFNIEVGMYQRVRIGIIANQENNCTTPDSRIGFGGQENLCGPGRDNAIGNVASCDPDDGNRNTAVFGYIYVR